MLKEKKAMIKLIKFIEASRDRRIIFINPQEISSICSQGDGPENEGMTAIHMKNQISYIIIGYIGGIVGKLEKEEEAEIVQ